MEGLQKCGFMLMPYLIRVLVHGFEIVITCKTIINNTFCDFLMDATIQACISCLMYFAVDLNSHT